MEAFEEKFSKPFENIDPDLGGWGDCYQSDRWVHRREGWKAALEWALSIKMTGETDLFDYINPTDIEKELINDE